MPRLFPLACVLIVGLSGTSSAAPIAPTPFSGFGYDVNYCDQNGLWNEYADNTLPGAGLDWYSTPISAPGNPWQQVSIAASLGNWARNGNECALGYTSATAYDALTLDTYGPITPITYSPQGGFVGEDGSSTLWRAGDLRIYKHEYWGAADRGDYRDGITLSSSSQALIIDITITNMGCEDQKVYFMHGVDPDQDVSTAGEYRTCNDTVPSGNFVFSEGLKTGIVTAYGRCDEANERVGHTVWDPDATGAAFNDEGYTYNDYTQHINHYALVPALDSVTFTFIFVTADTKEDALKRYYVTRDEVCCDPDYDDYEHDRAYLAGLGTCGTFTDTKGASASKAAASWISPNESLDVER